jgi:NAD-dependent deacetylase
MFSERLVTRLRTAHTVTAITGAGISAESGIPTFRGEDGLWKQFKPEELANFDAFMKNPELVWEWFNFRKKKILEAQPNRGHIALAAMEKGFGEFTLITQNVDGLHQKAGSKKVIELHGNIFRNKCIKCGNVVESREVKDGVPKCEKCGNIMRPDVVWFGEELPKDALSKAQEACSFCEVLFCIGTSGMVYPANSLPSISKANGSYVVEVNIEDTELTPQMTEAVRGKSAELLPKLVLELFAKKK